MVKATGIVTGVTPVPPLRMTELVWVPGAKGLVVACKVTVPVPVPTLRVNQPEFSLAVQCKGAAAGIADDDRLRGGPTALLDRGEREARRARIDGGRDRCTRDSAGDGGRH